MDTVDEECLPEAATACKRLKRTNSKEMGSGGESAAAEAKTKSKSNGESILVGKEANAAINSLNNNNSNSNKNCNKEELEIKNAADEKVEVEEIESPPAMHPLAVAVDDDQPSTSNAINDEESSSNPFLDISPVATALLSAEDNVDDGIGELAGNADVGLDVDANFRIFNTPRTRSYRNTLLSLFSSSSSNDASEHQSEGNSDANNTTIEDDDDVDDDDVDDDEVEFFAPENEEPDEQDASRSPAARSDGSSSHSSNVAWNRDYFSSNAETESDFYNETEANPQDDKILKDSVNNVLNKSKPSYNWNFVQELMQREQNVFNRIGWRGGHTSALSFGQGYYASRQVVERMKLMISLSRHRCCVNCLSFNRCGDLICSGSDDLRIIVWDWANGKPRHSFKSGHNLNIFQTKFIDSAGCLDVISSSRDGQVRRAVIPPSGSSSIKPTHLYSHREAVHKLVVVPHSRHEVISAGEDAAVKHFDLRSNQCTTMLRCVSSVANRRVRLFSIAHHPFAPEFCVSGSDDKLRVYDKRKPNQPVHQMSPKDAKVSQITCAVYNYSGSEILASYSDAAIYLYDSRNYKDGEFLHSYEGHINSRTIKGVNFFGPHSEYIVSGSDDGNIFFWDKNTEAVMNFMKGDHSGVVNCLEQHPTMPVLATSGLDHNVKIWTPSSKPETEVPCSDALEKTLQRNFRRNILMDGGDFDINQIHYFIRQLIEPRRGAAAPRERLSSSSSISTSSNSTSSISSSTTTSGNNSINPNPGPAAASNHDQQQRQRRRRASSSDDGNADPIGCRSQ
ncbi:DDB1- and CUL4-associated factor 8 [Drosophila grimshawi]|uniref:GH15764 n=1 Tax=Drosophila grimshawi TaxID=7222 RepID=B4IYN1_DROGR|nr:DDB1- and CUL4-associated factor 8 [Drosophila grimshawi]EDV95541.1 GH15764 [Drosophila grimshawi]